MQSIKYAVYQKWVPKSVVKMQQIKLQFKLIVYSVYSCYQTFSPENLSYLQSLQQMHSKIWDVPTYIHTMDEKYVPELIVKILSISVDTEETLQSRDFSSLFSLLSSLFSLLSSLFSLDFFIKNRFTRSMGRSYFSGTFPFAQPR